MEKLVKGFLKFRTEVFDKKKALFTRLSENQTPRALFITCSDSRVDPTLLTQTDPGELFILRNAGNMVPPYGSMQGGSTATIEYAMAVLKVPHIIVCGHTDCGVMKALLHPEDVHGLPAVKEWLGQAETTRRLMHEHYTDLEGDDRLIKTTQENVRSQLDHLRTHPSVALLLRQKKVDLHGWVYSISTGDVWVYDFEFEQFTSLLDETYPRLKTSS
ncbi:MAG: carbonic anhydrase [Nitrospira sp. CG24C]|jgi:carbonic anhydrase|nr:MAG: carbonic anhydrase [Nitrospira sp. CG24C]